jgi:16S rRNA (cytidine1402-2'-O)-methyltransferase
MFEENRRGPLSELITYFAEKTIKGELVICVQGKEVVKGKTKRVYNNDDEGDDTDDDSDDE